MLRTALLATALTAAYAVALAPRTQTPVRGEDLTDYLDGSAGESTRRKAIPQGTASIVARVLCGEVARQGDAESRAVWG